MTTSIVTVHAWELHSTTGGSDKYYRLLLIDRVLLVNYGRRGSRGQFYAHCAGTVDLAKLMARDLTNQKDAKGYHVTRDMTTFKVPEHIARTLTNLSPGKHSSPVPSICDKLVRFFKMAANQQATALEEASW